MPLPHGFGRDVRTAEQLVHDEEKQRACSHAEDDPDRPDQGRADGGAGEADDVEDAVGGRLDEAGDPDRQDQDRTDGDERGEVDELADDEVGLLPARHLVRGFERVAQPRKPVQP
jgi:hypothetical protein